MLLPVKKDEWRAPTKQWPRTSDIEKRTVNAIVQNRQRIESYMLKSINLQVCFRFLNQVSNKRINLLAFLLIDGFCFGQETQ